MMIEIDDDLLAAIGQFENCPSDKIGNLAIARIFQLAVDERQQRLTGQIQTGSVFDHYACQTFPVIARIYHRAFAKRDAVFAPREGAGEDGP